jgi:hypothetical protein
MERTPLSHDAEKIRVEIREMIPEAWSESRSDERQADVIREDTNGNKLYGGEQLAAKITQLQKQMQIDQVSHHKNF